MTRKTHMIGKKKAKKAILPFFIPMEGCPHQCVFCDQSAISGQVQGPSSEMIDEAVAALSEPCQLAFYGGSFSALPRQRQAYYLMMVQPYLSDGRITSVRVSTRPDYIDTSELDFLASYGVNTIELGVQSLSDEVLKASGRGYNAEVVERSVRLIKAEQRFNLGIQLMTGLPRDNYEQSLETVHRVVELAPDFVRIYPTLVLRNTPLATLFERGQYEPQTLGEAVYLCRDMAAILGQADIPIIRMGLNHSADLVASLLGGPYAEAFGSFVKSALKLEQVRLALSKADFVPTDFSVPQNDLPDLVGHGKSNKNWLQYELGLLPNFHGDDNLVSGELLLSCGDKKLLLSWREFLQTYVVGLA